MQGFSTFRGDATAVITAAAICGVVLVTLTSRSGILWRAGHLDKSGPVTASVPTTSCGRAYLEFQERLRSQIDRISDVQLAVLNRKALRIYDTCDSGRLDQLESKFLELG
jgi:hypothetical protein